MLKAIKLVFFLLVISSFLAQSSFAQMYYPRVSPGAKVSQMIGITEVTVNYHRPGVKGRLILGELVPFDEIWRTGANEATTIQFSNDVTIADTKIPAGKYSLFTIIDDSKFDVTIIINKNPNLWGTSGYKQEEDLIRFGVKPEHGEHQEWLKISFENLKKNSADLRIHWENFSFGFTITVDTDNLVLEGTRKELAQKDLTWREPYRAANYCLENEVSLEEGKTWIDQSLAKEKNYWNTSLKAKYFAQEGKYKDALKTMNEALAIGQKMDNPPYNMKDMENLINEWSEK